MRLCDLQVHQVVEIVSISSVNYDAIVDLLELIKKILDRLDIYTELPPMVTTNEIVVQILIELLSTIALATKQVRQGRFSESIFAEKYLT